MRNTAFVLVLMACGNGGSSTEKKDAPTQPPIDAGPEHDAPPLVTCTPRNGTNISIRMIGQVSGSAVLATAPKNDGRLFVIEQQGRIRIFENEMLVATPYLDVSNLVSGGDGASGDERGLLGLAFHPNFAANRQFFVFYTTGACPGTSCVNIVARYTQSATNPNVADTQGETIITIPDFAGNHNGGMIEFGPDGYLYIGTGDGGGGGDPQRTAQNKDSLMGKILRIDVNTTSAGKMYGMPSDNPYAAGGGAPEVYILGLRNPWRWSFDSETGDLWIGDVGQGTDEEVTVLKAGQLAGANLGWSMYEGTRCFGNYTCAAAGMTMPQVVRSQGAGWRSVIGGQVYRGSCFPDIRGFYFFADYVAGTGGFVRGKLEANGTVTATNIPNPTGWPGGRTSLHADARGELFLTTTTGRVYQLEANP